MATSDKPLRVLLLEPPSTHRDGKQLQLELEGYEVTATWEVTDAMRELPEVAFTYLVLGGADEAGRWRELVGPAAATPVLVFSQLSREALADAGMNLRVQDLCAKPRN